MVQQRPSTVDPLEWYIVVLYGTLRTTHLAEPAPVYIPVAVYVANGRVFRVLDTTRMAVVYAYVALGELTLLQVHLELEAM